MAKKRGKGSSAVAAAAQWKIGDLVLAKVKGFPAWPAQVSRAEDFGRQRNPAKVFVVFYGTKQIRFCHHNEISAFSAEARAALHTRTLSKCVPSDLRQAVKEICAVADQADEPQDTTIDEADKIRDQNTTAGTSGYRSDQEETSSNADNRNFGVRTRHPSPAASDDETFTLESSRGNGSSASQANNGGSKRKRVKVRPQVAAMATTAVQDKMDDNHLAQREWESSCTNSCNSFPDRSSKLGVPLVDRVRTNFASHEELDSFGKNDEDERSKQVEQPLKFSWLRQCSRTSSKFRKRSLNFSAIKICQKRKRQAATKRLQAKVVISDSDEQDANNVEGFGDSLEKKSAAELKAVAVKKQRTSCSENEDAAVDDASDKHLPLLKRASARIIHEGTCFSRSHENNGPESRHRRFSRRTCADVGRNSEANDLQESRTSNTAEKRQLPLKAEKYRLRSSLLDGEAALPPSKRRQRVLEAMTVCAAEGTADGVRKVTKVETRKSRNKLQKKVVATSGDPCVSNQEKQCGTSRAEKLAALAKARKLKNLSSSFRAIDIHSSETENYGSSFKRRMLKHNFMGGGFEKRDYGLSLDDLPATHGGSRFYCEDVNRVREAYEAAKEKKQKLASKNTSAPSTSMKYLLAVQKQTYFPRPSELQREAALRLISVESLKITLKLC